MEFTVVVLLAAIIPTRRVTETTVGCDFFTSPHALLINVGEANDQVDRCCCLCVSGRDVGAGHVARAASSTTGQHNHAGRARMWTL